MAEFDDISGLLGSLLGSSDGSGADSDNAPDIDPELLLKILDIASRLSSDDKYSDLLRALRPLLREENRPRLDRAAFLMKLVNLLPLLRELGL